MVQKNHLFESVDSTNKLLDSYEAQIQELMRSETEEQKENEHMLSCIDPSLSDGDSNMDFAKVRIVYERVQTLLNELKMEIQAKVT